MLPLNGLKSKRMWCQNYVKFMRDTMMKYKNVKNIRVNTKIEMNVEQWWKNIRNENEPQNMRKSMSFVLSWMWEKEQRMKK